MDLLCLLPGGVAGIPSEQLQPLRPDSGVILHAVAGYFGCETEDVLSRRHQEGYLLAELEKELEKRKEEKGDTIRIPQYVSVTIDEVYH